MVNEASVSEPCGLWVAHPGCVKEVNNRRSHNFLFITRPLSLKIQSLPTKTYLQRSHKHKHSHIHKPQLSSHLHPCVRSHTITVTVIHRCWILLASHKTWYAWFVQSARSVISFSFSFILPSWATRSIFLLYESADTQRDFQDDYMPRAMGGWGAGEEGDSQEPP